MEQHWFEGTIEAIHVAPDGAAPMEVRQVVEAVAGAGLAGDRYLDGRGTYSGRPGGGREVTLIEAEALEAIEAEDGIVLRPDQCRRNLLTRGVPLNHLVGREFTVGPVRLRGVRLCEPCQVLEGISAGSRAALVHRGGLRADLLGGGTISVGDAVRPAPNEGACS